MPQEQKPTVFISYSHEDEEWKDRLVSHLGVLREAGVIEVWEDRQIAGGDEWLKEIQNGLDKAHIAVFLVSANSLTSQFILKQEIGEGGYNGWPEGNTKQTANSDIQRGHLATQFIRCHYLN